MKRKVLGVILAAAMIVTAVPVSQFRKPVEVKADVTSEPTDVTVGDEDITSYEGYELVWNDEFSGQYLDKDKWRIGTTPENGRHKYNAATTNGELENENIYLENDNLILKATDVEDYVGENGKSYFCNSGMVETLNKADWRYGRFDISAKLPVTKGMWPAIWMMPTKTVYGWPKDGEIDIMELISQEKNVAYGTVHCGTSGTADYYHPSATYRLSSGDYSDEFHVFSMEWEPGIMRFYVDNNLYLTLDNWKSVVNGTKLDFPHPFNSNFYLKLNLAAGGNWCENPDSTTQWGEESTMYIDYVRVYKQTDASYTYSTGSYTHSGHRQGAVWYAQEKAEGGSWVNMDTFNDTTKAWEKDSKKVTSTSLTPTGGAVSAAFSVPETGYVRIDWEKAFKTQTNQESITLNLLKESTSEGNPTSETIASYNVTDGSEKYPETLFLQVTADDVIRFEAESGNNTILDFQPIITYVTQADYDASQTNKVSITGNNMVGEELVANLLDNTLQEVSYQWLADDEIIPDAIAATYHPTLNDVGKKIKVKITSGGAIYYSAATRKIEERKTFIDDTDPAVILEGFRPANGTTAGEWAMNGTFQYSVNNQSSSITYTFTGTGIEALTGTHPQWTNPQTIRIENSKGETVVNQAMSYNAGTKPHTAFKKTDLPLDTYTVTIVNDGTKNKIEFDGFWIYNMVDTVPEVKYTVTFNPNEGTVEEEIREVLENESVGVLPVPVRAEYDFKGWFTEAEGGVQVTEETIVTAAITYYAQWTPKEVEVIRYTITFNGNEGTVSETTRMVEMGNPLGELPTPVRSGYNFLGWFTAEVDGNEVNAATIPSQNATYYAHWQQQNQTPAPAPFVPVVPSVTTYTVSFDGNGGTASKESVEVNSDETVGTLPVATRDGYEFVGWFTESTGGTEVTSDTKITAAMKVYAQWKEVTEDENNTGFSGKKTAGKSAKIKWNKNKKAESYELYMKTGKGEFQLVKTLKANKTSYTVAGLKTAKKYQFRVVTNTGKEMKKKVTYGKSVTMTWKNVSGYSSYDIMMKVGKDPLQKVKTVTEGGTISYTVKTAKVGKKYTFQLNGVN